MTGHRWLLAPVLGCAACGGGTAAVRDAASPDGAAPVADAAPATRTDLELTTEDGLRLTGYLTAGPASTPGAPGVVLVHQYLRDDEQWGDLPGALAGRGYRVLAFNLRGHGDSDPYQGASLDGILTDPDGAPRDVAAALAYLRAAGAADPQRIAVVGTSIGANLAVAASIHGWAKTYVAFSSRRTPTESLAGAPATGMASVFYLAGENDTGGQAADAQTMFDATTPPRDLRIYAGSTDHGIAILDNQADARQRLFEWLATNL